MLTPIELAAIERLAKQGGNDFLEQVDADCVLRLLTDRQALAAELEAVKRTAVNANGLGSLHPQPGPINLALEVNAEKFLASDHGRELLESLADQSREIERLKAEMTEALVLNNEMKALFDQASDERDAAESQLTTATDLLRSVRQGCTEIAERTIHFSEIDVVDEHWRQRKAAEVVVEIDSFLNDKQ